MPNRNALDAVFRLKQYIKSDKVYISKYDFANYFDSISSAYIKREVILSENFLITNFEKRVIQGFLSHEYVDKSGHKSFRDRGVPPGKSLSLFVANAVGHSLDISLDKMSGNYIRYADDSVLVNYGYEDAINVISAYRDFSRATDVRVNPSKTTGVSIFSSRQEEMRSIQNIDFLGYRFSESDTTISPSGIERIKKRCSQILYETLLLYPKRHRALNCDRLDGKQLDWDFVSCIHRLRSYINGPYTNSELM